MPKRQSEVIDFYPPDWKPTTKKPIRRPVPQVEIAEFDAVQLISNCELFKIAEFQEFHIHHPDCKRKLAKRWGDAEWSKSEQCCPMHGYYWNLNGIEEGTHVITFDCAWHPYLGCGRIQNQIDYIEPAFNLRIVKDSFCMLEESLRFSQFLQGMPVDAKTFRSRLSNAYKFSAVNPRFLKQAEAMECFVCRKHPSSEEEWRVKGWASFGSAFICHSCRRKKHEIVTKLKEIHFELKMKEEQWRSQKLYQVAELKKLVKSAQRLLRTGSLAPSKSPQTESKPTPSSPNSCPP